MEESLERCLAASRWMPDTPDFRDWTLASPTAFDLNRFVEDAGQLPRSADLRTSRPMADTDLRSMCGCAARSVCDLLEYFRATCEGDTRSLSPEFCHQVALTLEHKDAAAQVSLREVLRGLVRCGVPPRALTRTLSASGRDPLYSPMCYQFADDFRDLQYFRLARSASCETLTVMKRLVSHGIPILLAFPVPSTLEQDPRLDIRSQFDAIAGYATALMVGYDDDYRIDHCGAVCLRCPWGTNWGDAGHGWMSQTYFELELVVDVWLVLRPCWLQRLIDDRMLRSEAEPCGDRIPIKPLGRCHRR